MSPVATTRRPNDQRPNDGLHLAIYAHHHGAGHLARATAIAQAWPGPVTVLTSARAAALDDEDGVDVVQLPLERCTDTGASTPRTLHHAPLGDAGLRRRMARLSRVLEVERPDVVLVDVSIEVGMLTRLHGVPTAMVRQPGRRDDPPHCLGHATADLLLAPWGRPGSRDGVVHTGLLSRFDHRHRQRRRTSGHGVQVVVAIGTGGTSLRERHLTELADRLPDDHRVRCIGEVPDGGSDPSAPPSGYVEDPWPLLLDADVVVTAASLNLLGEVAAADVPVVAVPETRPHDEHETHVEVLAEQFDVPVAQSWDDDLAGLVEAAMQQGAPGLSDRRGARRAVAALHDLASVDEVHA